MTTQWVEMRINGSTHLIRQATINRRRFSWRTDCNAIVAICEDGIKLFDMSLLERNTQGIEPFYHLYSNAISFTELGPLFNDEQVAREILKSCKTWHAHNRNRNVTDGRWRLFELADRSLVLARDVGTSSPELVRRRRSIAVCILSNGVSLHKRPLAKAVPPTVADRIIFIPARELNINRLQELFDHQTAVEILALFNLNRKNLLNLINCTSNNAATEVAIKRGQDPGEERS